MQSKVNEAELDDAAAPLKIRIGRLAFALSSGITEKTSNEKLLRVNTALGLLNQATAVSEYDNSLAVRLFNQARVIARKVKQDGR